jgi:hypothetical protein
VRSLIRAKKIWNLDIGCLSFNSGVVQVLEILLTLKRLSGSFQRPAPGAYFNIPSVPVMEIGLEFEI